MKHPRSRAERRVVRDVFVAYRKFIHQHIWRFDHGFTEWGRYAKFNLNCGCMMCHSQKYFSAKRQRRRALQQDIVENLRSWE